MATTAWRWLFLLILAAALPARADDLVTTTAVVVAGIGGRDVAGQPARHRVAGFPVRLGQPDHYRH